MSEREELVARYRMGGESVSVLARAYGVGRKTAYKWIQRAANGEPLDNRSRRPCASPRRTSAALENAVVAMRETHPTWGGRKIHHALRAAGIAAPAPSTIQKILGRNGFEPTVRPQPTWIRFEAPHPNDLWQMDFKGWHPLRTGRVYPLTILDDHSRFLLTVHCMEHQSLTALQPVLIDVFRRYGLPWELLCDNSGPWGTSEHPALTRFDIWMMQLDIRLIHGRPYHPQTQGKLERLHRTLKADVFAERTYRELADAQTACSAFRHTYNLDRPHEALGYDPPVAHYQTSPRPYSENLPDPVYPDDAKVRRVSGRGYTRLHGRSCFISKGLAGHDVGIVPTTTDGTFHVYFHSHKVSSIDLRQPEDGVTHVREHL